MLNVLHVIGQLVPGGSEKMTLQVARAFEAAGSRHPVVALRAVDEAYVQGITGGTVSVYPVEARRSGLADLPRVVRTVGRLAREHDAALIQGHALRSSVVAGIASQITGIPAVATLHRLYYPGIDRTANRLLQHLWRAVVVDSEAVASLLVERAGIGEDRVNVIRNFVADEMFEDIRRDGDDRDGRMRILTAAHFSEVKGHRFLLSAVAKLERQHPGSLVVDLVGDGPLLEESKALARELGIDAIVHFHGRRHDLEAWLAAADVVVLPSLWEGFGLILAEAAAFRLPAVSFAIGGAAEVIVDEQTGLLVPPGDVDALAAALRRLQSDPNLRHSLGDAARARAESHYRMDVVIEEYGRLYSRVAA